MAFVAEDGTGLAAANSLASVEFADDYFEERGVVAWTGTDTAKEQALVRATDYVETRWSQRFAGSRETAAQALSWPRVGLQNPAEDGSVPQAIKRAVAEYALRALTGDLLPDPTVTVGPAVESVREKVGPLETETRYANAGNVAAVVFKPVPKADMLVRPYLRGAGIIRG